MIASGDTAWAFARHELASVASDAVHRCMTLGIGSPSAASDGLRE